MTDIYLIRHCEAQGNVLRQLQGITDADVTELGKKQLKALSKRFEFVTYDENKMSGTYVRYPERSELNADINESLIIEFYNR